MRNKIRRALAVVAAIGVALPLAVGTASASQASDERGVFRNAAGLLQYEVHLPPAYQPGKQLPVVVALHGCGMTGYEANSMKAMSRFNEVADAKGFIVVYPAQDIGRNLVLCWNANVPAHQKRGSGEPSLLAGATADVVNRYHADAKRVHVAGASSGAAMSVIMAVTYPDVYASAAPLAGGEYAFDQYLPNPDKVSPVDTAKLAYAQMGPRARQVPILITQGDADKTVDPINAQRLVTHWAAIDDLAVDGQLNGDVDDVPDATEHVARPGEYPYTHASYTARAGGAPLIEKYFVEGLAHKWPGGGTGQYADPMGPFISGIIWDFFATRHLP
ncbi:extracellular catalytic domain type 1 short-chain-length polyhydroxyalkanoate depolymerase [Amycolatopsis nigrescens]|uniref:extracellular catalytic domain type 1 short-chain-length polyhydroxyalkanoate depolymerase n=1 Tax=Amycolatopsis nigrescens TaxID=381445 RepID=UPI0003744A71|nr:PHB depolymerase family esterase [Amycolatopsis nigrescens]